MSTEENQLPNADERIAAISDPPTSAVQQLKRRDASKTILLLFASMGMALGMIGAAVALGSRDEAKTELVSVQEEVAANAEALEAANKQLIALGKAPVPVPPQTPAPVQQDEFTAEEAAAVRAIVLDQIATRDLTQAEITQIARVAATLVPKPADGKSPTPAELQLYAKTAVAAYCTADRCVKQGDRGDRGGIGPAAPKVTDEELLKAAQQALASYCAQETKPCTPKDGTDGKDAPPPYSVVDQDCEGDGPASVWRVYLSNGNDQKSFTTEGPCRIGPDPN